MSKRHLSSAEIDEILSGVSSQKSIIPGMQLSVKNKVLKGFRKQLSKYMVYPEIIPRLKKEVEAKYLSSFIPPGEMVGILASQSIESLTQMSLSAFHSAGLAEKDVSIGLPRFEEILNATSNPKIIGFTFIPSRQFETVENLRFSIRLAEIKFKDLIKKTTIFGGEVPLPPRETYHSVYELIHGHRFDEFKWMIRLEIKTDKLFRHSMTAGQISRKIESGLESLYALFSPDQTVIDIYPYMEFVGGREEITYISEIVMEKLMDMSLGGVSGIEGCYPKERKGKNNRPEWIYEGNGGTLIDLLSLEDCNATETSNDNMWDIHDCLGVEATRAFLVDEFTKIMSFDGSWVNPKHIMLLADRMTLDGTISAVNRYGMNRDMYGPLAKASFEETVQNFLLSSIYGETDDLKGVSAAIITGRSPAIGATGITEILVDLKKLDLIEEEDEELVYF